MKNIFCSLILVLMVFSNVSHADEEIRIPTSLLVNAINKEFQGIEVRLNNYGSRHGNSWYKGNDSYIKLPSALGGKRSFSIPAVNKQPFRYYVNDIKSNSARVSIYNGRLLLSIGFEKDGSELKGRCAGKWYQRALCITGSDKAAPDVQINNAVLKIFLTPAARNNSISFSKIDPVFEASIYMTGTICGNLPCDKVVNYKSIIRSEVKKVVNAQFNNSVRDKVANALKAQLSRIGIKNITNVRISGGQLIVRYKS